MIHNGVATMSEAQEIAALAADECVDPPRLKLHLSELPSAVPPLAGHDPGTIGALSLPRRHLDFLSQDNLELDTAALPISIPDRDHRRSNSPELT
jgi:hypothetical protein